MRRIIALRCTSCGAPAADSVVICPYCCKATGFDSLSHTPGIEVSDAGDLHVGAGAHLRIAGSVGESGGACPFCGANAEPGSRVCEYCDTKLVIERMRVASLVIAGGSMTITSGGSLEVIGRRRRALHQAAADNDLTGVKQEIADGDDPDFEDSNGRVPSHYAAMAGAVDTAQWLLSIGAKPNARDDSGETPLQAARLAQQLALVDLLSMYSHE